MCKSSFCFSEIIAGISPSIIPTRSLANFESTTSYETKLTPYSEAQGIHIRHNWDSKRNRDWARCVLFNVHSPCWSRSSQPQFSRFAVCIICFWREHRRSPKHSASWRLYLCSQWRRQAQWHYKGCKYFTSQLGRLNALCCKNNLTHGRAKSRNANTWWRTNHSKWSIGVGYPRSTCHVIWSGMFSHCSFSKKALLTEVFTQAECSFKSSSGLLTCDSDPRNLGWGIGSNYWVVDPEDHSKLLPIGAVGEYVFIFYCLWEIFFKCGHIFSPSKTLLALAVDFVP